MGSVSPRFTIITVSYNAENNIGKTLASIKAQTYKNYEVILVDGNSSDNTLKKAADIGMHNLNVISEEDSGIYDAMNKGVKLAAGEYIYFLNVEDYFYDDSTLEKVNNKLNELSWPELFYGDVVSYVGDKFSYLNQSPNITKDYFLKQTICHQAIFAKKQLFDKYGFFKEKYKICADLAWLAGLYIQHGVKFSYDNIPICYYSLSGISSTKKYTIQRYLSIRKQFGTFYIVRKRLVPWVYKRIKKPFKQKKNKI